MSIYSHRVFFNLITFFLLNSAVNQLAASEAASSAESESLSSPASVASVSKGTIVHLESGEWDTTPIRRGKRSHDTIKILNSVVKALDASCFQSDAALTTISFNGSSLDFSALVGYFGQGCPNLKTIDLTGTKDLSLPLRASQDITIERFVQIAHSDLLDLIVDDQTSLQILITKAADQSNTFTMDEIRKSLLAILLEQKKQAARGILASVGGAVSGYLFSPRSATTSASSGSPSIAPQAEQGDDENEEASDGGEVEALNATAAATPAALNALGDSRRLPNADDPEDATEVSGSPVASDRLQESRPLQAANSSGNSAVSASPLTSGATVAAGQGNGSSTQASSGPAATSSKKKKGSR